jgi:hypothetical protein
MIHIVGREGAHLICVTRESAKSTETLTTYNVGIGALGSKGSPIASLVALAHSLLLVATLPIDLLSAIVSYIIIIETRISSHIKLINSAVYEGRWCQSANLIDVTIDTHDVRWHHELHVETRLTEDPIALLALILVALGSIITRTWLLMLRNKYLLRQHLRLVLIHT